MAFPADRGRSGSFRAAGVLGEPPGPACGPSSISTQRTGRRPNAPGGMDLAGEGCALLPGPGVRSSARPGSRRCGTNRAGASAVAVRDHRGPAGGGFGAGRLHPGSRCGHRPPAAGRRPPAETTSRVPASMASMATRWPGRVPVIPRPAGDLMPGAGYWRAVHHQEPEARQAAAASDSSAGTRRAAALGPPTPSPRAAPGESRSTGPGQHAPACPHPRTPAAPGALGRRSYSDQAGPMRG